jgi:hypothetical protein
MMIIYFFNGLAFGGLGLAAYLQRRQGGDLPLNKHLRWLAAFGFACGVTSWIDMFLTSGSTEEYLHALSTLRMITQPPSGRGENSVPLLRNPYWLPLGSIISGVAMNFFSAPGDM